MMSVFVHYFFGIYLGRWRGMNMRGSSLEAPDDSRSR